MDKLDYIKTRVVPLPIENVDTDQIIPARFLKATTREGFGDNLFRDWRYYKGDEKVEDFVLNNNKYEGQILVAGKNFGCGSSREHAAWAIYDHGFRVVISSFFADIFKANALNNGLLPITVTDSYLDEIFQAIESDNKQLIEVSLTDQVLKIVGTDKSFSFEIDDYKKQCLLEGKDDIDFLVSLKPEIESFESKHVIF